jgi:hypothetical protein
MHSFSFIPAQSDNKLANVSNHCCCRALRPGSPVRTTTRRGAPMAKERRLQAAGKREGAGLRSSFSAPCGCFYSPASQRSCYPGVVPQPGWSATLHPDSEMAFGWLRIGFLLPITSQAGGFPPACPLHAPSIPPVCPWLVIRFPLALRWLEGGFGWLCGFRSPRPSINADAQAVICTLQADEHQR